MFASGLTDTPYSNGPVLRNRPAKVLKVESMTCISPTDGCPAFQLLSHLLTIVGLPPDSVCIWYSTASRSVGDRPASFSAWTTVGAHRRTPGPPASAPAPPDPRLVAAAAPAAADAFANEAWACC